MRLVLDAGALIGVDRSDPTVLLRLRTARDRRIDVVVPSPVVAQVWRSGQTQANLARALRGVEVIAPDDEAARRCGEVLAATSTADVVDGFVAVLARNGDLILTSDVDDIEAVTGAANVSVTILKV
jgi:predicted nucleic acid-binding protein